MRPETYQEKLNKLLGITEEQVEALAAPDNPIKEKKRQEEYKSQPRLYGYTEDEFKNIRIMQGTMYFLQAPELFTIKQCSNCLEWFAVSRQAVGYCSYECLAESFRKMGLEWSKGGDLLRTAQDPNVWNGNEPLWTLPLSKLKKCLQVIIDSTESSSTPESSPEPIGIQKNNEQSSQVPIHSPNPPGTIGSNGGANTSDPSAPKKFSSGLTT